tara:strand:+ start:68 stop:2989 length:2922 start_codon:yes stop_codon:yes gene_type:complete
MSDYTKLVDFASKDALPTGDPDKIVKGAEIETELDNVAVAIATKTDSGSPTFTGIVTLPDLTLNAANPEILGGDTDGVLYIAPSTTKDLGGNFLLYGDTHATKANDVEVRATTGVELHYDDSASTWDFQANAITTTGTLGVTGVTTVGASILSDTDSTDSLGSTGVRWLKVWTDTLTAGTLTIGAGSIVDSSGAISFGNENLVTTGTLGSGALTATSLSLTTDLAVADGGTGASTLTDGGVLLGSGTGAITAMAVLADGEMIVGDGTTDPVAESGATLRTSIGVDAAGTDNSTDVTFAGTGTYISLSGQQITVDPITESDISDLGTYQTAGAVLTDLNTLGAAATDGQVIVATGAGAFAYESGATLRTSIGVDAAGTDNSTAVTFAGTGTYISLSGQQITVDPITLSDVSDSGTAAAINTGTTSGLVPLVGTKSATLTLAGLVEQSTSAENVTGTDDTVFPSVAGTKEMIDTHASAGGAFSTSGTENIFGGTTAGDSLTSGTNNFFVGLNSGTAMLGGGFNVAIGSGTLDASTAATNAIVIGTNAVGTGVMTGADNIAIGQLAGNDLTSGHSNIILGKSAAANLLTSDGCIVIGENALDAATAAGDNTIALGTNAIGTGVLTGADNIAIGQLAGNDLTSGHSNVLMGLNAGANMTTADGNVFIGEDSVSLGICTGDNNVSIGNGAGKDITSGTDNVFIGTNAGANSLNLTNNICIGKDTGKTATALGGRVIAIGQSTMSAGTATGSDNIAMGYQAGNILTSGKENIMIGFTAGVLLTTANTNVFIGHKTGLVNASGQDNVHLGNNLSGSAASVSYEIVIGNDIAGGGTETTTIGSSTDSIVNDWGENATWTHSSDERMKNVIGASPLGLDFINNLNTIEFTKKPANEWPEEWGADAEALVDTDKVYQGMLAQDVRSALDGAGVDNFGGWREDDNGRQRIGDAAFVFPLIKAVQELTAKVAELQNEVTELQDAT